MEDISLDIEDIFIGDISPMSYRQFSSVFINNNSTSVNFPFIARPTPIIYNLSLHFIFPASIIYKSWYLSIIFAYYSILTFSQSLSTHFIHSLLIEN